MIDVVQTIADLDQSPELHVARLILLLSAFEDGREG